MISVRVLLDMVATEAIDGAGIPDHFFDESRGPNYPLAQPRGIELSSERIDPNFVGPPLPQILYEESILTEAEKARYIVLNRDSPDYRVE